MAKNKLFVSGGGGAAEPVTCLGMKFPNDDARRQHFLDKLREKLKDPAFRKIEGFPVGKDEDILTLSDPPYYTACPNPFLADFVKHRCDNVGSDGYHREPFAADVNEGKNDPIYNAHSYHTKVPHKAIMRYILHYTEPGDIVFDGFCGTGMTGVAANLCGDAGAVQDLGYSVNRGVVRDADGDTFSKIGPRFAILNDLSPAATLIAAGYNLTHDAEAFAAMASQVLNEFEAEYGWMYQTTDPKTKKTCAVNFTVWSEIFTCPQCSGEIEFWSLAYDEDTGKVAGTTNCPHCGAEASKKELLRKTRQFFDPALKKTRSQQVLTPVLINYTCNGEVKEKTPDKDDLHTISRVEEMISRLSYPTELIMFVQEGKEWGDLQRGYHEGITHVHDFHLSRQLVAMALLWELGNSLPTRESQRLWRFTIQSVMVSFTRRNRFLKNAFSQVNRALSGTLYVGSTISEPSPRYVLGGKIKRFVKAIPQADASAAVTTQSLATTLLPPNSVDYVFIDPPFGDNLPYAELNFLWEAWLRVFTKASADAIVSGTQGKDIPAYTRLMTSCLEEVHRILKPGRWVTVEFHNSQNAVWASIQEALGRSGFIIADVRVLDKGMLTKKQLHANAVNKDLVISAYKPNGGLEDRFRLEAGKAEGVWDFLRTHLKQLPVFVAKGGQAETIAERQNFLLFDRMVAFHVQRGVTIPMSAPEFYAGLERFPQRDGMCFLPEQAVEYDKKRMTVNKVVQLEMFVSDEASAIQWIRQQLAGKPQTFQEIQPQFMREIAGWQKHEQTLELSVLLEQSFLCYRGGGPVTSQVHAYLSSNFKELRNLDDDDPRLVAKAKDRWYVPNADKEVDLEQIRLRALLKEFRQYQESKGKLKVMRTEALRAGFKECWQSGDYATIVQVAKRVSEAVVQEDPALLMYYDNALMRTEG
jgi:hypothetical protein